MIWLKRLLPFVIIVVAYFAYDRYTTNKVDDQAALDDKYALAVAQIWIASAHFHDQPEAFMAFRDSLMKADGLSRADLSAYVSGYKTKAEELAYFSQQLKHYTDSLYWIEDSLRQVEDTLQLDSLKL